MRHKSATRTPIATPSALVGSIPPTWPRGLTGARFFLFRRRGPRLGDGIGCWGSALATLGAVLRFRKLAALGDGAGRWGPPSLRSVRSSVFVSSLRSLTKTGMVGERGFRTSGPYVPNVVLYQAELLSDTSRTAMRPVVSGGALIAMPPGARNQAKMPPNSGHSPDRFSAFSPR